MKKKTIKSILTKKFNDWVSSIEDEDLRSDVKKNSIITGGAITSLLLNESPKDYDVYFTNKETVKKVAVYYAKEFIKNKKKKLEEGEKYEISLGVYDGKECLYGCKENIERNWYSKDEDRVYLYFDVGGVDSENEEWLSDNFSDVYEMIDASDEINSEELEEDKDNAHKKYRPIFLSPNAITLSDKVQIVIRFYGDAQEIHKNYDFIHCTNYWESGSNKLVYNIDALESILSKSLFYQGSKYPIASIIRTRKFIKRGWSINAGQYLKMILQVGQLNLGDIGVLRDQLVGVDSAYFSILINALEKKKKEDPNFDILDNSYIVSIIDKIF